MSQVGSQAPIPEPLLAQLIDCQRQMRSQGVRRLLVLSGEADWCERQAVQLMHNFQGDWPWIAPQSLSQPQSKMRMLEPEKVNQLLGQEFMHGVFDAGSGLNAEALAAFSGVLRAGSWLVLLAPAWPSWPMRADSDSLRWSELPEAIATPRFINRFCQQILQDKRALVWRQGEDFQPFALPEGHDWRAPQGAPTTQQQIILDTLLQGREGIFVLTAARGRGKSTLAGMLVQQWRGPCWVTAPGKASAQRIVEQSDDDARFWAPDALLAHCESGAPIDADWLLIDEAAAIPAPLLARLIAFFPRVLLTTTVQGYEGTGRGFLLKFCASLPQWHDLRLRDPIRWAQHDPLEELLDRVLLFGEPDLAGLNRVDSQAALSLSTFDARSWEHNPALLADFYQLLTSAHYRTSPIDLRRMLDAPGMSFAIAQRGRQLAAALWLVEEGGVDAALAHEVWAGRRRPRGNLVAQSMAAHGGFPEAAVMRSRRVSRIAVAADSRRQGVARTLIAQQRQHAREQGLDFLSVSFGFTDELWRFWHSCGFEPVRVGGQREASSGCFATMALLPLSDRGIALCQRATQQLYRNRRQIPAEVAAVIYPSKPLQAGSSPDSSTASHGDKIPDDCQLNDIDWRELGGFAFASRSLDSSRASLLRLLFQSTLPLPALRYSLLANKAAAEVATLLKLSGKKALLQRWREETRLALGQLDVDRSEQERRFAQ